MYKKILIPIDNSLWSKFATSLAIALSESFGSILVGLHAYAARLHDIAFRKLERGLPKRYSDDEILNQRMIHDSLITEGLKLIAETYLKIFSETCISKNIPFDTKVQEGKNFMEIIEEARGDSYDLVVLGANGLGKSDVSIIGSVCERVARLVKTDILIVKNGEPLAGGKILICIDGSPNSFEALRRALIFVKAFDMAPEAVTVFDPYFHKIAFNSIAEVITQETAKIFRLKEQERIHDEINNKGLKFVAETHLDNARSIARAEGIELKCSVLEGKPFRELLRYAQESQPTLLVTGRFGTHRCVMTDIGSQAENILRLSSINQLIVNADSHRDNYENNKELKKDREESKETPLKWTEGAIRRLENIPEFTRETAKYRIETFARKRGYKEVDEEVIDERYRRWGEEAGEQDFSYNITWEKVAKERIDRIPPFIRSTVINEIEAYARKRGLPKITLNTIEEAKGQWADFETFHESKMDDPSYQEAREKEKKGI